MKCAVSTKDVTFSEIEKFLCTAIVGPYEGRVRVCIRDDRDGYSLFRDYTKQEVFCLIWKLLVSVVKCH